MTPPTLVRPAVKPLTFPSLAGIGRSRDYLGTFGSELLTLISTVAVLKLAAEYWGPSGFGEFMLARRTLGLLQLPVLCGMGVGVTRFVARARAVGDAESERRYAAGAVLVAAVTVSLACAAIAIVPGPLAHALFGSAVHADLLRALGLGIAGLALHGVAYGVFRGRIAMAGANLLQVVNLGLVPMAVLAWPGLSVVQVVKFTGVGWLVIAGFATALQHRHSLELVRDWDRLATACRELLRYGVPRVPGEFALASLFALPVTIAAHDYGLQVAGFVALGVSLLTMIGSLFAPLGQIVLPVMSARAVAGDPRKLRSDAKTLTLVSVVLAVPLALAIEFGAPYLIPKFFGPAFADAVPVARILSLAVVPYVGYIVLRNVLDALHTLPLNAKNLALALGVFLAIAVPSGAAIAVPWGLVIALCVLGLLSWYDARRQLARLADGATPPLS